MGWDGGRHAHGDACCAIGEQVREGARKHGRLAAFLVIGGTKIDCVLIDALKQQFSHRGHLRFGVTHGGGVIAVDIAEIALPVDERIANGEILRQTHQRVVDRLVAVRVKVTHHLTDDLGGFLVRGIGSQPHLAHGIDDAAVNGLQPVPYIRQCPVHDGRQRVGKIALFERLLQVDRFDFVTTATRRQNALSHRVFPTGRGDSEQGRAGLRPQAMSRCAPLHRRSCFSQHMPISVLLKTDATAATKIALTTMVAVSVRHPIICAQPGHERLPAHRAIRLEVFT